MSILSFEAEVQEALRGKRISQEEQRHLGSGALVNTLTQNGDPVPVTEKDVMSRLLWPNPDRDRSERQARIRKQLQ